MATHNTNYKISHIFLYRPAGQRSKVELWKLTFANCFGRQGQQYDKWVKNNILSSLFLEQSTSEKVFVNQSEFLIKNILNISFLLVIQNFFDLSFFAVGWRIFCPKSNSSIIQKCLPQTAYRLCGQLIFVFKVWCIQIAHLGSSSFQQ